MVKELKQYGPNFARGLLKILAVIAVALLIIWSLITNAKVWWNGQMVSTYQAGYNDARQQITLGIIDAAKTQGGIVVTDGKENITLVVPNYANTPKQ